MLGEAEGHLLAWRQVSADEKVTWPQACRAEARLVAYQNAREWIDRYTIAKAYERLCAKIQESEEVLRRYNEQQHRSTGG